MDDCPGHHFHLVFSNGCGVHHSSLFFRRSLTTHTTANQKQTFRFPLFLFWFYYFVSVFYPTFLSYFVPPCCCYSTIVTPIILIHKNKNILFLLSFIINTPKCFASGYRKNKNSYNYFVLSLAAWIS